MKKKIWYISKYCNIPTKKNLTNSRGWILMKKFVSKGCEALIITSDNNEEIDASYIHSMSRNFIKINDIQIIVLKTLKYSISKSFLRIVSWLHFEFNLFFLDKKTLFKPDIIIVSSLSLLTILNGIILKKKYRCKLIFEVRDIWPLTLIEEGGFSSYNPFIAFLGMIERLGYKKSELIVGTMPNLGEHVKNVLGYPKPVKCIPMGIDLDLPNRKNIRIPEYIKRHVKSEHFNVVHTGSIGISNALDTFFKAAEILQVDPKFRFIIVGDGALRKDYIKQFGYLSNLIYFPKVDKDLVQSFLNYADLVYFSVHKSKVWDYGQSLNKIIDYMIAEKPIVASYSGYPSMINEANCGYFVPAEDANSLVDKIKEISLMSATERKLMGTRGLEWLKKHRSYDKLADNYLSIIFENED
jgi:glycosyltransferase involved in cell wall biosynthesis